MISFSLRRLIFTLVIVLVSHGCTVNKRYHNSGMGIQWHLNLKPVNSYSKIDLDKKKKTPQTTGSNTKDNNCSAIRFNSNDQIEAPKTTLIKPTLGIETSSNSSSFHYQTRHTNDAIKIGNINCIDSTDKPLRKKVMHQNAPRNASWSLVFALLGFTFFGMFLSPIAIYLGIKAYYQGVTYKNGLIKAIAGELLGLFFLVVILLIVSTPWGG